MALARKFLPLARIGTHLGSSAAAQLGSLTGVVTVASATFVGVPRLGRLFLTKITYAF